MGHVGEESVFKCGHGDRVALCRRVKNDNNSHQFLRALPFVAHLRGRQGSAGQVGKKIQAIEGARKSVGSPVTVLTKVNDQQG